MNENKLFTPGQKVTPTKKMNWFVVSGTAPVVDVPFGKIVTVAGYDPKPDSQGRLYIYLVEFPAHYSFAQNRFSPVVSDTVLAEELSEIFSLEVRK